MSEPRSVKNTFRIAVDMMPDLEQEAAYRGIKPSVLVNMILRGHFQKNDLPLAEKPVKEKPQQVTIRKIDPDLDNLRKNLKPVN